MIKTIFSEEVGICCALNIDIDSDACLYPFNVYLLVTFSFEYKAKVSSRPFVDIESALEYYDKLFQLAS